jgi:hypothetical protein
VVRRPLRLVALTATLAMLAWMAPSGPAQAAAPALEKAPTGLHDFPFTLGCCYYDFEDVGYTMTEYIVSGEAKTYTDTPTTAPYAARIVVVRPSDPAKFNGTLLAEWENVSAQFPAGPGMVWLHHHIIPRGYGYIAVNAQKVGHDFLQKWDPVRYASLGVHPGDDYSFDIFSQAVKAIRHPSAREAGQPMEGLKVQQVVGYGQSQSAGRLNSYMNLAQNDAQVLDAAIIQADGGARKSFPDLQVPLVQFETEDAIHPAAPDPANSPEHYRLWEVVGTAHLGSESQGPGVATVPTAATIGQPALPWELDVAYWEHNHYGEEGPTVSASAPLPETEVALPPRPPEVPKVPFTPGEVPGRAGGCGANEMPFRYALEAALEGLRTWLRGGPSLPQVPRATFEDGVLQRDRFGNALGGLRLPPIDVPVANYSAEGCSLFGSTTSLTPDQLLALYPTNAVYVAKMKAAIEQAVAARIMTPEGGAQLLRKAQRSFIPLWSPSTQYGLETALTGAVPRL